MLALLSAPVLTAIREAKSQDLHLPTASPEDKVEDPTAMSGMVYHLSSMETRHFDYYHLYITTTPVLEQLTLHSTSQTR